MNEITTIKLKEVRDVIAQFPSNFTIEQLKEVIDTTLMLTQAQYEELENLKTSIGE